jgi:hypothetical protein
MTNTGVSASRTGMSSIRISDAFEGKDGCGLGQDRSPVFRKSYCNANRVGLDPPYF